VTTSLARRSCLPTAGRELAEAIQLSRHCLGRFALRANPDSQQDAEAALRDLIAARGVVRERPPAWFHGGRGASLFYIVLDDRYVIPLQQSRLRDGAAPVRPYVATTFVSRDLTDADIAVLAGEGLARLVALPKQVLADWAARTDAASEQDAETSLREDIAARGRCQLAPPAWLGRRRLDVDAFHVLLGAHLALTLKRTYRRGGAGARYRAVALLDATGITGLRGDALVQAIDLDVRAVREYHACAAGVPDDARSHLTARIAREGGLLPSPPDWAPSEWSADGPLLALGEGLVLVLRPARRAPGSGALRWRATHCFTRPRS
jgi:hypothetical protein